MKFVRLVLAFYFMALSLMPCEDAHAQSRSSQTAFSVSVQESYSKDDGDICSPLCICNCCQMTVAAFKMEPFIDIPKQVPPYFSKKILFQKNDFVDPVYGHIWQPPKI